MSHEGLVGDDFFECGPPITEEEARNARLSMRDFVIDLSRYLGAAITSRTDFGHQFEQTVLSITGKENGNMCDLPQFFAETQMQSSSAVSLGGLVGDGFFRCGPPITEDRLSIEDIMIGTSRFLEADVAAITSRMDYVVEKEH